MNFELENDEDGQGAILNNSGILDGPGIEIEEISESPEPQPLTKKKAIFISNVKKKGKNQREYLPANVLLEKILEHKDNWPKSVNGLLVVIGNNQRFQILKDKKDFFAWVHSDINLQWISGSGISKDEFFKFAVNNCDSYEFLSDFPHYPPIRNVLYLPKNYPNAGGEALNKFISYFCPASHLDARLIQALALTLFWGGPPGQRPGFLLTTEDTGPSGGIGYGKTTLANKMAELCGGSIVLSPEEGHEAVAKRILSPANGKANQRVLLLDNIKKLKLSNAGLEALITSQEISGHRMYGGHAVSPNYFVSILTLNGASLSRDLASRCVPILLGKAPKNQNWLAEINAFVEENRDQIIGDIGLLLSSPGNPLPNNNCTRWANWEAGVLNKVDQPVECRNEILSRQAKFNGDASDASGFIDLILEQYPPYGNHTQSIVIRQITYPNMVELYKTFSGKTIGRNKIVDVIKVMGLDCLINYRKNGRPGVYLFRTDRKPITSDDVKNWENKSVIKPGIKSKKKSYHQLGASKN
jgi:hypothetical protein